MPKITLTYTDAIDGVDPSDITDDDVILEEEYIIEYFRILPNFLGLNLKDGKMLYINNSLINTFQIEHLKEIPTDG